MIYSFYINKILDLDNLTMDDDTLKVESLDDF